MAENEEMVKLTKGQKRALLHIMRGKNVFVTGGGGVGKSFLLQEIVRQLWSAGKRVAVCAPTGVAAIKAGGVTVNRLFGFPAEICINNGGTIRDLSIKRRVSKVVQNADVIIMDEVSMCRMDMFDAVCASIRKAEEETGKKKQFIVMGDFCQLPPVLQKKKPLTDEEHPDYSILKAYYKRPYIGLGAAFEGYEWKKQKFFPVILDESVRQKDPEFIKNLNLARLNDPACLKYFNKRCMEKKDGVHLLARNEDVRRENRQKMEKLSGDLIGFETQVTKIYAIPDPEFDRMLAQDIPETLWLTNGAEIIVTANDYSGAYATDVDELIEGHRHNYREALYYNGLCGKVVQINAENKPGDNGYIVVTLENGRMLMMYRQRYNIYRYEINEKGEIIREVMGFFQQFPILPAYALTVHRAQGQTLAHVRVAPDSINSGQLYVALSRATTVDGISLDRKIRIEDLRLDPAVKQFYDDLGKEIRGEMKKPQGRPSKSEGGTVKMWIPAQLERVVKEECDSLKMIKIYKIAKYKPDRVQMRVPTEIAEDVKQQVTEWKKAAKAKQKEAEEAKESRIGET